MNLTVYKTPQEFLAATRETLEAKEVVNSLMLGVVENLLPDIHHYGDQDPYLAVVEHKGRQVVRASMTPPHGLLLTFDTINLSKPIHLLVDELLARGLPLPDVSSPKPASEQFAQTWAERTGGSFKLEMAQRLYELTEVTPVEGVGGELAVAAETDIPLITRWLIGFNIDCFGEVGNSEERIRQGVTRSIKRGLWHLWKVDAQPVSMSIKVRPTRSGIGVSGVYTPPEYRNHGYASACVAALSQKLLDEGFKFCSLFTDLANPTSNKIYMRIGYRPVSDFDKFKLITPAI
jgi:predicted GNAT family acetyltransferase